LLGSGLRCSEAGRRRGAGMEPTSAALATALAMTADAPRAPAGGTPVESVEATATKAAARCRATFAAASGAGPERAFALPGDAFAAACELRAAASELKQHSKRQSADHCAEAVSADEGSPAGSAAAISEIVDVATSALSLLIPASPDTDAVAAAGDASLAAALPLCAALLDVAWCRRLPASDARAAADAALAVLRSQQTSLSRPCLAAHIAGALRSAADLVPRRHLGSEALRRLAALAAELVFASAAESTKPGVAVIGFVAADALISAIEGMRGSRRCPGGCGGACFGRTDGVQIVLDILQKRLGALAAASLAHGTVRHMATVLVRMLRAVCAFHPAAGEAEAWMPAAHKEACSCARLISVALMQSAARGSAPVQKLVERLIVEVARLAAPPSDAAVLAAGDQSAACSVLLSAISGTLTALLRTRRVGDMKLMAVRCLGQIAVHFAPGKAPPSEACSDCQAKARSCRSCKADGQVLQFCIHGRRGAAVRLLPCAGVGQSVGT